MEKSLKILLIEDNLAFREGLKTFLTVELKHVVVGEVSNEIKATELIPKIDSLDIVIMKIDMAKITDIKLTEILIQKYPYLFFLGISMYKEKLFLLELIKMGFKGCINKQEYFKDLPKAIKSLMVGKQFFS